MKTTNTQPFIDNNGEEHIVCPVKLVLIKCNNLADIIKSKITIGYNSYDPILISEKEEIQVGDKFITNNNIYEFNKDDDKNGFKPKGHKIISLLEQLPQQFLNDIVDGKYKDGDELMVKCELRVYMENLDNFTDDYFIHLNPKNQITIFLVKKEEGWDEIIDNFSKKAIKGEDYLHDFINYLKTNYYSPPKKK
jgi:hypothetical protein